MRCLLFLFIIVNFFACQGDGFKAGRDLSFYVDPDTPEQVDPYRGEDRFRWQKPDLVIDSLGDIKGKTIVDLGAGSGYFAFRLVKEAGKVIALDIDPRMIQLLEEEKSYYNSEIQSRFESRLVTPNDPGLAENEADAVLVVNTYPYISNRVNYFSRLKFAVVDGGMVMVVDFKKQDLPIGPSWENKLAMDTVVEELKEAGYTRIDVDNASLDYQYIVRAYVDK